MSKSTKSIQDQLVERLADLCSELNLVIALPVNPQDGVLLGTPHFVGTIVAMCNDEYDTMGTDENGELIEMVLPSGGENDDGSDPTFH